MDAYNCVDIFVDHASQSAPGVNPEIPLPIFMDVLDHKSLTPSCLSKLQTPLMQASAPTLLLIQTIPERYW